MTSGHLIWSVVPLAAVALTACAGCRIMGSAGSTEHRGAPTRSPGVVATDRAVVEFEGREPFEYIAPQTPALSAVTAGPVIEREAWALAFFAAGVSEGQVVADIEGGWRVEDRPRVLVIVVRARP